MAGYIPISPFWKEVSVARLENATNKFNEGAGGQLVELVPERTKESEDFIMSDVLEEFEVIDTEVGRSDSVMT